MSKLIKIVKLHIPLISILPSTIVEVIKECVLDYVKKNGIEKYDLDLGCIEEKTFFSLEDEIIDLENKKNDPEKENNLSSLMTYPAKLVESYIFNYYKVNKEVYHRTRNEEIIKIRQEIQFFMFFYAGMSLANIGSVTGGYSHATVLNSKGKILRKITKTTSIYRKEIKIIDVGIMQVFGLAKSKVFDIDI